MGEYLICTAFRSAERATAQADRRTYWLESPVWQKTAVERVYHYHDVPYWEWRRLQLLYVLYALPIRRLP